LSPVIRDTLVRYGCAPQRCFLTPNGARQDLIRFEASPTFPDRSVCLGRVLPAKRQALLQRHAAGVDFVGDIGTESGFDAADANYLGPWTKQQVYDNLTRYANLVLLSDGEAHSLVVVEALMAGLGVVVSEAASANLDLSREFIDVVPEPKINDAAYVREVVERNRAASVRQRDAIRRYAVEDFDWGTLVRRYADLVAQLVRAPVTRPPRFWGDVGDALRDVPRALRRRLARGGPAVTRV
jgi:glycosyltransferase involved in cell wall biosynthesis